MSPCSFLSPSWLALLLALLFPLLLTLLLSFALAVAVWAAHFPSEEPRFLNCIAFVHPPLVNDLVLKGQVRTECTCSEGSFHEEGQGQKRDGLLKTIRVDASSHLEDTLRKVCWRLQRLMFNGCHGIAASIHCPPLVC